MIKKQKTAFWKSKSKIYLWNDEADYDLGDLVYDPSAGNNKFFWQVIAKNGSTHEMVELSGLNGYPKIPCGSLIYSEYFSLASKQKEQTKFIHVHILCKLHASLIINRHRLLQVHSYHG